ncbi:MAG: twin-arginine translocase subunit TatC [Polynucleobacter sp.]|nr:twin-arginine translocase subunit TatC [Polynucleobacter sp.]
MMQPTDSTNTSSAKTDAKDDSANKDFDAAADASVGEGLQETFLSHLFELRDRIIKASLAVIIVFASLAYWAPDIFHIFAQPLLSSLPEGGKMIVTDITGSFFVPMKVTMLVAFLIALPWVMYQLWAFIAPGLYQHERKLILPLVVSSYSLFLIGMAFAYFLVFPTVFNFMAQYNAPLGAEMTTDIDKYLSFAMTTFLAFGITFEVPVVVVVLVRMGMVTLAKLREARPYVIVGAFVIAAIVTPPDVLSQLLLAIPMTLLYELGLLIARFYEPKKSPEDEAEAAADAQANSQ